MPTLASTLKYGRMPGMAFEKTLLLVHIDMLVDVNMDITGKVWLLFVSILTLVAILAQTETQIRQPQKVSSMFGLESSSIRESKNRTNQLIPGSDDYTE